MQLDDVSDFDHIDDDIPRQIFQQEDPCGFWIFRTGHQPFEFGVYYKPRWLTRWAMRAIFDIQWADADHDDPPSLL